MALLTNFNSCINDSGELTLGSVLTQLQIGQQESQSGQTSVSKTISSQDLPKGTIGFYAEVYGGYGTTNNEPFSKMEISNSKLLKGKYGAPESSSYYEQNGYTYGNCFSGVWGISDTSKDVTFTLTQQQDSNGYTYFGIATIYPLILKSEQ